MFWKWKGWVLRIMLGLMESDEMRQGIKSFLLVFFFGFFLSLFCFFGFFFYL